MFASTRNAANSPPTNWISSDATIGPDRLPFGLGEVHVVFAGTPAVRLNPVHEVWRGCPPDGRVRGRLQCCFSICPSSYSRL
jgi:hypothetical protein